MDSTILNVEDWMKFCHTHFEDICNFINKGNVNNDFKEVFEFWKRDSDTKHLCYWKIPEMHRISKTEVYNAIEEFVHIVHIKAMHKTINPILNGLIKRDVSTSSVSSAYDKSETLIRNIMEKYFNINIHTIQKDTGDYHKCELKLLELYKNYFGIDKSKSISLPIWVARECRNKIHPVDKKDKHEITEIKGYHQARELAMFLIWTCIEIIALCRKTLQLPYEKTDFHPGETIYLKILNEKCSSVEWSIENNGISRANGTLHKDNLAIPDVFKYEDIKIKVITENAKSIDFNISLDGSHYGRKTIVLDCLHNTFECDSSAMKETVKDNCTNLSITSDLECELESSEIAQTAQIRPGEITQMLIPKGKQTITLTSNKNPKYRISREIDIDNDTVINDMLFSREVRKHREWWNVKDIVVLRKTFNDTDQFILWDKTVDLPVYFCICHDDKCFDDCETGFTGNFFYVKEDSNGYYRYYDLSAPGNDRIVSENLFTFNQGYEFTGCRGIGDALVIGENGAPFLTIFKSLILNSDGLYDSIEWPDALKEHYDKFIRQFQFSEGWAAMLGPDGSTIRFISDKWKLASDPYSYLPDKYPVFHKGYCVVKKGKEGYLFLKSSNGYIKETNERYDFLLPIEIGGNWIYIAQKDGLYGILDPAANNNVVLPISCDMIESKHGICSIKKEGKWVLLYGADIYQAVSPPYDCINIVSSSFFLIGKQTNDSTICQYLCTKGKFIADGVIDHIKISDDLIAAKLSDGKWNVFDIKGNCHLENYSEIILDKHPIYKCFFLLAKKNKIWEVWKVDNSHLSKLAEHADRPRVSYAGYRFREGECSSAEVSINGETIINIKDADRWVWNNNKNLVIPKESISIWYKHSLTPFSKFSSPKRIGLMKRDTFSEIIAPVYNKIYRIGDIWIAEQGGMKTFISDTGDMLARNIGFDSIKEYSTDLYSADKDGDVCLINARGIQKSKFYSEIRPIVHGYAAVRGYLWGVVRITGEDVEVICEPEFHAVKEFTEEGYAMVRKEKDGKWGMIDKDGNLTVDCSYDHIDPFECNFTSVRTRKSWTIINKDGQELVYEKEFKNRMISLDKECLQNKSKFIIMDENGTLVQ